VRLLESKGFAHTDLMPIGMADTQPIVPNRSATGEAIPENQAENRRIVIRIEKQLPQRTSR
jgi:chemotaxis protein MotB